MDNLLQRLDGVYKNITSKRSGVSGSTGKMESKTSSTKKYGFF